MKTTRQIRQWLESHKWYNSFRKQVWGTFAGDMIAIKRIMSGELGENTISSGFDWRQSAEGIKFWSEIDNKFREWYEKEGK